MSTGVPSGNAASKPPARAVAGATATTSPPVPVMAPVTSAVAAVSAFKAVMSCVAVVVMAPAASVANEIVIAFPATAMARAELLAPGSTSATLIWLPALPAASTVTRNPAAPAPNSACAATPAWLPGADPTRPMIELGPTATGGRSRAIRWTSAPWRSSTIRPYHPNERVFGPKPPRRVRVGVHVMAPPRRRPRPARCPPVATPRWILLSRASGAETQAAGRRMRARRCWES